MEKRNVKIALIIADKQQPLEELSYYLNQEKTDIYLFPEGFLHSDYLSEFLKITEKSDAYFIVGLDDNRATDKLYETVLVIHKGEILGEHKKVALTVGDIEKGHSKGNQISALATPYGKFGFPICYEIHFPEICRLFSIDGAHVLWNQIGTGMHDVKQMDEWLTIAKARAIENEVYVFGCSNYRGEIPLAFAFAPDGSNLGLLTRKQGALRLSLEQLIPIPKYHYLQDRTPEMYFRLSESDKR